MKNCSRLSSIGLHNLFIGFLILWCLLTFVVCLRLPETKGLKME